MDQEKIDFYSNNVNIVTSLYDITLQFTSQLPIEPPKPGKQVPLEISGICNVKMSPQHAKALAAVLVKNVIEYEEKFSTLPIPEKLEGLWKTHIRQRRQKK